MLLISLTVVTCDDKHCLVKLNQVESLMYRRYTFCTLQTTWHSAIGAALCQ